MATSQMKALPDIKTPLLLPLEVLNKQICSECLNWLSVGPIMTQNEKILCGRCVKLIKNTDNLRYSLYNKVAESSVFHCINLYDGCNDMLMFNETTKHESTCTGRLYNCTYCSFQGNSFQFIQHNVQLHPEKVLKDGTCHLNLADSEMQVSVYYDSDHIFHIKSHIYEDLLKICVRIINFAPEYSETNTYDIKFHKPLCRISYTTDQIRFGKWFEITVQELKTLFQTNEILCTINPVFHSVVRLKERDYYLKQEHLKRKFSCIKKDLILQEEYKKLALEKKSFSNPYNVIKRITEMFYVYTLNCVNCKQEIKDKLSIFICPQSHISCATCLRRYCQLCKAEWDWINCDTFLKDLNLSCDWQGCQMKTKVKGYLSHKQICEYRQYDCPSEGCDFKGNKQELILHWHLAIPLKVGKALDFLFSKDTEIYWIVDDIQELLHVTASKYDLDVYEYFTVFPRDYKLRLLKYNIYKYELIGDLSQAAFQKRFNNLCENSNYRLTFSK